jgi:hypothetical protein
MTGRLLRLPEHRTQRANPSDDRGQVAWVFHALDAPVETERKGRI